MSEKKLDLYDLLPAVYRVRDAERGYPLRALLDIISEQAEIVRQNIDRLWDDFFIETCADWVIPYIGNLVGNNPLHEVAHRRRADVAKTIYYRRRKGTLPVLEELARDVTGWGAHAVAFFELLGWTQNLNHPRYRMSPNPERRDPNAVDRVGTVNLRDLDALDRLNGPFDIITHTADVRPTSRSEGWYGIRNIGFFLWRLQSYPLTRVNARRSTEEPYGYHFSSLGNPTPLFNNPQREAEEAGLATEIHVPGPIRPTALASDLECCRRDLVAGKGPNSNYYGENASLSIRKDGVDLPPQSIVCMNLEKGWTQPPSQLAYKDKEGNDIVVKIEAGVDVRRGRIAFAQGKEPQTSVEVSFHYGFSADVGGGPYDRRATLANGDAKTWHVVVAEQKPDPAPPVWKATLQEALETWNPVLHKNAIITIADNRTYEETITLQLSGSQRLVIQAENGKRPMLRFLNDAGELSDLVAQSDTGKDASLTLNGLLIEGGIRVEANSLGEVQFVYCTLVPGRQLDEAGKPVFPDLASIVVEQPNTDLKLTIDHSIVGPMRLPEEMKRLTVKDSIIDSPGVDELAQPFQALVSGNLSDFPEVTFDPCKVQVMIGDEGPFTAVFTGVPGSLAQARDQLEAAIRRAHTSDRFTGAVVEIVARRLVVLPGLPGVEITFSDAGTDDTATKLRLVDGHASRREVLLSAPLSPSLTLKAKSPAVQVSIGDDGPHIAAISGQPSSLAQVQDTLEKALRNSGGGTSFTRAYVMKIKDSRAAERLLILPGEPGGTVQLAYPPGDPITLTQLRFRRKQDVRRLAVAATDAGDQSGPPTTLERTTVFGEVLVRELTLASEVIFTHPVLARRRQVGCLRFSYLPDVNSKTPRRYRCQPDLALEARAKELNVGSVEALPEKEREKERELVRSRLRPAFTSTHYGDPGYAQLSLNSPEEIATGAEDGAEIGAFNHLKQPQRRANLRIRLEEYLPFGLEAGFIYVT